MHVDRSLKDDASKTIRKKKTPVLKHNNRCVCERIFFLYFVKYSVFLVPMFIAV